MNRATLFAIATLAFTGPALSADPVKGSTPDDPALSTHREVTGQSEADRSLSLPTPFPNIVRAWTGDNSVVNWKFNKDASEISLLSVFKGSGTVHLVTAEKSGIQEDGLIVFSALDSTVVGEKAKLETHPGNHRIGFWVNGNDFVKWSLDTPVLKKGNYEVELVYSRAGQGDATASVTVNETELPVPLKSTGSWYVYQVQSIGEIKIPKSDKLNIEVRSVKQSGAVMNLKAVLLHPVK